MKLMSFWMVWVRFTVYFFVFIIGVFFIVFSRMLILKKKKDNCIEIFDEIVMVNFYF